MPNRYPAGGRRTRSYAEFGGGDDVAVVVDHAHLGQRVVVDGGHLADAAVAVGDLDWRDRDGAAVGRNPLKLIRPVVRTCVHDREYPRGAALIAVHIADILAVGHRHRRRSEALAVGHRERGAIGVGEVAVVREPDPDRGRCEPGGGESGDRDAQPRPGAAAGRLHHAGHALLESGGRLGERGEQQQLVGNRRHALNARPALRAVGEVLQRPRAVGAIGDAQRDLGAHLFQPCAVVVVHDESSPLSASEAVSSFSPSRPSFSIAVRMRVFAVPSGIPSISPISRAV